MTCLCGCGKPVRPAKRGSHPLYASLLCRQEAQVARRRRKTFGGWALTRRLRRCDLCGHLFVPKTDKQKRCSPECTNDFRLLRMILAAPVENCDVCGRLFLHWLPNQKRCSDECRIRAHETYQQAYRAEKARQRRQKQTSTFVAIPERKTLRMRGKT